MRAPGACGSIRPRRPPTEVRAREGTARAGGVVSRSGRGRDRVSLVPAEIRWDKAFERRDLFLDGLAMTVLISVCALVLGLVFGAAADWPACRIARARSGRFTYVNSSAARRSSCSSTSSTGASLGREPAGSVRREGALVVGIVGLGLFAGAYIAEIVRAGVESIDRGQWEAARSLGLSHRSRSSRDPAAALRRMIPPLTGEAVSLVKESSLLSVIGVRRDDVSREEPLRRNVRDLRRVPAACRPLLCITLPLSWFTRHIEQRLAPWRSSPWPSCERSESRREARGLTKRWGDVVGLAGVDLDVRRGEV